MSCIRSKFLSKICPLVAAAGIFGFAHSAQATVWDFLQVLDGTGVTNFGASLFHDASTPSAQGGGTLSTIPNDPVTGTFDDVTGIFSNAVFNLPGASSFSLSGSLIFGGGGFGSLDAASTLDVDFMGVMITGLSDTTLGFNPGQFCCGSPNGPNTFLAVGGNSAIITLWGADGFKVDVNGAPDLYGGNFQYNQDVADIGLDLRILLTRSQDIPPPIPLPAALPLFGTGLGLLGFLGWRRRRKAGAAV